MNALFAFETAFNDGLRCVPMAVRLKLDQAGVKMDLRAWVKFTDDERRELLDLPAGPGFRNRARALATERLGEVPKDLPVPEKFPWEQDEPPADLAAKAAQESVSLAGWTALSHLQRFALAKLSRPSHENHNFLPACREFGLPAIENEKEMPHVPR